MKPKLSWGITCILALTAAIPALAQDGQDSVPRFESTSCPFEVPAGQTIDCGWLFVPEDHRQPEDNVIKLAVVILKTPNSSPQPDPIVYLNGGPGAGAAGKGAALLTSFSPFLVKRDVVILDQRGAGISQPSLQCPEFEAVFLNPTGTDEVQGFEVGAQVLTQCRDRLRESGINLATYNSAQNAADIAALRVALGYEQVNLIGGSYGTRLALTVMRDYPIGIRSVVLDSTYPPQSNIYLDTPANFERAFMAMVDNCNADLMCRLLYPDIRGVYFDLFARLNVEPVSVTIDSPDRVLTTMVDGQMLSEIVRFALYSREGVEYLPAILYAAQSGEYELLKPVVSLLLDTSSGISHGMFFSVQCNDEAPFTSEQKVVSVASDSPAPFRSTMSIFGEFGYKMCQLWGLGKPLPIENDTVSSSIPTLIMGGEFDPVTPPIGGENSAAALPHSHFFLFPGVSHGVISAPCPVSMVLQFLDDPSQRPDSSCIATMRSLQFVITAAATRPIASASLWLLGAVAIWGATGATAALIHHPRQVAWRASLRAVGWVPFVISSLVLLVLITQQSIETAFPWHDTSRVIESIIPLIMAIQAAMLFSPDDEPALEVLLACPRRISWLLLERLGIVMLAQAAIALTGVALSLNLNSDQEVLLNLLRWIPPALFLSGVGVCTTVRSRVAAFGVTVTGLIWFGMVLFGATLLPGQPTFWPLNYLQPFLWPANPYLQPGQLAIGDYWLNRAFVTAAGIALIMLAVFQLRDEERVLLGVRRAKSHKGT